MSHQSQHRDPQRSNWKVLGKVTGGAERGPSVFARLRVASLCLAALVAMLGVVNAVYAHSVAQVQTTKYFTPETVQMLIDNANAGNPGLHIGETISYIIQFSPVNNAANVGVAGYITDYIPPGVQVIGASIVARDGSGNFYDIPPGLPGGIDTGWGNRGQNTFAAPFNTAAYDTTGRCSAAGFANNCNARLTELHADTGIFFSTDSRTSQYPPMPTRITQGTNGYNINPTGAGQLNPIINQASATTHNLWDADQTNAFGSSAAAVAGLASPKSSQPALTLTDIGRGSVPYNTGSAVAGPQTGYQLDNTAQVGPWQRISYPGSRMGDNTTGPATVLGSCLTCVSGYYTSVGWNLSPGNPLPAGTTAVRWAVGKLVVGEIRYVKISLRITGTPPSTGIINSSEVFGGDAADVDDGQDHAWRYHVPSVADNNSNLYVLKTVVGYYSGSTLVPSDGSNIPANAKVRYRIVYLNSGNANQNNVILSDTLPCQTAAGSVSNITAISGQISATINPAAPAAGLCPGTRRTFSFNNGVGVTLLPAAGGSLEFDVLTNAGLGATVTNTATLTSAAIPTGVTSNANSYVQNSANLSISKTTSTPAVASGGTATYTITVTNNGAAAASAINVYDMLPTMGGAANAATRFNFNAGSSVISGLTAVVPATSVPPTLTPYNTGGVSANQQQVLWNFGAQTLAAGASFTISFGATVGASVAASSTPYLNTVAVVYTGGTAPRIDASNIADVTVASPLSISKSIEAYYDTGTASWVPYSNNIPVNARVRYNISYSNTGATSIDNANISDTLPCQIGGAGMVSNINIVSGPIGPPAPNPPTTVATTCPTTQSFSFTAGTLNAGQTGQIKLDVQTNAALGSTVINTATLSGTGATSASGSAQSSVTTAPLLTISKTASAPGVAQGGSLSYTITVANIGTANATGIALYDWLPSGGAALNADTRFSYASTTSITGIASVAPTITIAGVNLTGTVSVTNSSATVTGTGTSFTTQLAVNDLLFISGSGYRVAAIANNTSLTLTTAYAGITAAGLTATKTPTPFNTDINAANMQQIVWNFTGQTLAPGASFTVVFSASAGASVPVSSAYYNNARVYYGTNQADSGAVGVAVGSNLSTSTKTWTDINGGDANPDDVIEWTITLKETAGIAAAGVSVSDTLPAALTSPTVVTCPAGATCGFAGQVLTATGISVTVSGTTAIVFRATVAAGTAAGTQINNCAAITNPGGVGATPCAMPITVSASTLPGYGNKPLYLYGSASSPAYKLSRAKPAAGAAVSIAVSSQTWTLSPALASSVTISNAISSTVPAQLYLTATAATNVTVGLYCGASLITSLAQAIPITATPTLFTFNLPTVNATCAAASSWAVRVTNSAGTLTVTPYVSAAQISNISLPSSNVIGVTSVAPYSTAYPGVTSPAMYGAGSAVYIRAVVSDPFGSYDITSASITIKDPNNTTVVSSAAMTMANDSGAATKTFEYAYVIPAGPGGVWNVTVTAKEGTENTISDSGVGTFYVSVMPNILIVKSVTTVSDPFNGGVNPKAIPGAIMEYTVQASNEGSGAADNNSLAVTDRIPTNTSLFVNDIGGAGSGPVLFTDGPAFGALASGLSYTYVSLNDPSDGLTFSNDGGLTFTYTPVTPDANGCDPNVTHVRMSLGGAFTFSASAPRPSFRLQFRIRVK